MIRCLVITARQAHTHSLELNTTRGMGSGVHDRSGTAGGGRGSCRLAVGWHDCLHLDVKHDVDYVRGGHDADHHTPGSHMLLRSKRD
jgi:hypothetical protein